MSTEHLTQEILAAALEGLEAQKQRLDESISEVRRLLGGSKHVATAAPAAKTKTGRRTVSPAARARMAEAQRLRWAKAKGDAPAAEGAAKPKGKRKMSAAARKRISEAAKKRWAAIRSAA